MSKTHILIVEDDAIATQVAKFLFESMDCQVATAPDGDKAVAMAKDTRFDAICMDIGLPTISGVEACKAIRTHEAKNNLPQVQIFALTGNSGPEEIKEYLAAGMQAVFTKPLRKEKAIELLSLLESNEEDRPL